MANELDRPSEGLGKASATALAREGVTLFIAARRVDILKRATDEIAFETGDRPTTVIADVRVGTDDVTQSVAGAPVPG